MALVDAILDYEPTRHCFEWRGEKLYSSEVSVQDLQFVLKKHPKVLDGTDLAGMVEVIIRKVEDKNGEKVFTLEHKPRLMRMPIAQITELFNYVFQGLEDQDESKKN